MADKSVPHSAEGLEPASRMDQDHRFLLFSMGWNQDAIPLTGRNSDQR
jgi:hypothetical protein